MEVIKLFRKKYIIYVLLLVFLAVAILRTDLGEITHSMRQIDMWSFFLLFAMQIVSLLTINLQWHKIAKSGGINISYTEMFYVNSQGTVVETAPGGKLAGEVSRVFFLNNTMKSTTAQSAAVMLIQKIFSFIVFFLAALFAISYVISDANFFQGAAVRFALYGVMFALLLLLLYVLLFPDKLLQRLSRDGTGKKRGKMIEKLKQNLLVVLNQATQLRQNLQLCLVLLLLSILAWALYPLQIYVLTTQLDAAPSFIYLGAITLAAYMISLIPIFPGGLGGFEGTMIALLYAAGVDASDALVVTILFRFGTFWFKVLICFIFVSVYKIMKRG